MGLSFLTPSAALLALAAVLPLAAFVLFERRAQRVRQALRLPEPRWRSRVATLAALVGVPLLLALAASQPVVDHVRTSYSRTGTETFFVFDTSRSMLARDDPRGSSRLERAKAFGLKLRAKLPDIRVGLASLSDRTLPHLFPTTDVAAFESTLGRAIDIEKPPPTSLYRTRVTTLGALSGVARQNFFEPASRHRLLVLFSDFESRPFVDSGIGSLFRRPPRIQTIFVRFWSPSERIYSAGRVEREYLPDPAAAGTEASLAHAAGGTAFGETQIGEAARRARELLGRGERKAEGTDHGKVALAPYVALGTLLPLSFLLWRRNL